MSVRAPQVNGGARSSADAPGRLQRFDRLRPLRLVTTSSLLGRCRAVRARLRTAAHSGRRLKRCVSAQPVAVRIVGGPVGKSVPKILAVQSGRDLFEVGAAELVGHRLRRLPDAAMPWGPVSSAVSGSGSNLEMPR